MHEIGVPNVSNKSIVWSSWDEYNNNFQRLNWHRTKSIFYLTNNFLLSFFCLLSLSSSLFCMSFLEERRKWPLCPLISVVFPPPPFAYDRTQWQYLVYETLEMAWVGEPIWVSTLSSHWRAPLRWISIQHGVEVTSWRWYSAPHPFTNDMRMVHILTNS